MPDGSERDERRQERLEGEAAEDRSRNTRLIVGYAVAATAVLAVAVAIFIVAGGGGDDSAGGATDEGGAHINLNTSYGSTNGIEPDERAGAVPAPAKTTDLRQAAKLADCQLRLRLKDEGHQHIPAGSQTPGYETNPPTSGAHVEPPYQQADGAYLEQPEPIDFVHSLEHGRLEIQYSPELSEEGQLALKGLYDTMYGAALLFPNDEMPYEVAATTWTNMLACPQYQGAATLDAIRAFGKATWGKYGGEPVYAFKFTGPTPAEPAEPS
ncbi:MAG TPA: DUF3105 domain-containing protein [Solirubrobacterales bacterium]|jgi:hypothetical protein|nr:DUF3105 domain-containing protein [Solirubrobacterales bacterium]